MLHATSVLEGIARGGCVRELATNVAGRSIFKRMGLDICGAAITIAPKGLSASRARSCVDVPLRSEAAAALPPDERRPLRDSDALKESTDRRHLR